VQLSEIARIYPGHPFRGKIEEFEDSGVLVVQMRDVSPQGRINWSSCIQTALPGRKSPKYLSVGDILVAARGSHNYAVEVVEEDVALCEFVCVSKQPLQKILREGLETMREQG